MKKKSLKTIFQQLKELLIPFEDSIKSNFIKNYTPLDCLVHLWSNLSKEQLENIFSSQLEPS
ncbi:unnamed protein product, partial [marine sediment metagenome]